MSAEEPGRAGCLVGTKLNVHVVMVLGVWEGFPRRGKLFSNFPLSKVCLACFSAHFYPCENCLVGLGVDGIFSVVGDSEGRLSAG